MSVESVSTSPPGIEPAVEGIAGVAAIAAGVAELAVAASGAAVTGARVENKLKGIKISLSLSFNP